MGKEELSTLWQELREMNVINKSIILNEYISVDNDLITEGTLAIEEIVACVHDTSNENDEIADETELELPPVSNHEAIQAMNIVRRYIEKNLDDSAVLKMCDKPDNVIAVQRLKKMKQSSLFYYQIRN